VPAIKLSSKPKPEPIAAVAETSPDAHVISICDEADWLKDYPCPELYNIPTVHKYSLPNKLRSLRRSMPEKGVDFYENIKLSLEQARQDKRKVIWAKNRIKVDPRFTH